MAWQHIRIDRFGAPEVLEVAEQSTIPDPGPGDVRIKVLAAGTGFTDTADISTISSVLSNSPRTQLMRCPRVGAMSDAMEDRVGL